MTFVEALIASPSRSRESEARVLVGRAAAAAQVTVDLVRERGQHAADQPRDAIGVRTGSPSFDEVG
jgi:hypothetical protein